MYRHCARDQRNWRRWGLGRSRGVGGVLHAQVLSTLVHSHTTLPELATIKTDNTTHLPMGLENCFPASVAALPSRPAASLSRRPHLHTHRRCEIGGSSWAGGLEHEHGESTGPAVYARERQSGCGGFCAQASRPSAATRWEQQRLRQRPSLQTVERSDTPMLGQEHTRHMQH